MFKHSVSFFKASFQLVSLILKTERYISVIGKVPPIHQTMDLLYWHFTAK